MPSLPALQQEQDAELERHINVLTDALEHIKDNPYNKSHLFVTDDDILSMPDFVNHTIFAVKAPPGTTLEAHRDANRYR